MRGDIIIVTGPPGVGKSAIAGRLARRFGRAVHLQTADFLRFIVAGAIAPNEPASRQLDETAMDVVAGAALRYAVGGYTTVVDGRVEPRKLRHFQAASADTVLHYVVLRPDRLIGLARVRNQSGAPSMIDEANNSRMWTEFADLGRLEAHVVDTSDDDTAASERRVLGAVRSGRMQIF